MQPNYCIGDPILHIELRRWADVVLVAPCDANTLAKIATGICDNLVVSGPPLLPSNHIFLAPSVPCFPYSLLISNATYFYFPHIIII